MRTRFNGSKNVTSCLKSNKPGRTQGISKFKKQSPKKEPEAEEISKEPLSIYNFQKEKVQLIQGIDNEEDLKQRLFVAENVMKSLFERNKLLEQQSSTN